MRTPNHVTRFLGIGKHALLGRADVRGVRGALGSETAKRWDAFVDQVRAEITDNTMHKGGNSVTLHFRRR